MLSTKLGQGSLKLFQKSKIVNKSEACAKSVFYSSFKRFSQQSQNYAFIDPKLLYPFSQVQTSKALEIIQKTSLRSHDLIILDKLTATDYSETYRAYDLENKIFVAQKKIHLNSLASWNQFNLILRQKSCSLFAQTLSIDYDEEKENVRIGIELQNTILKDYCDYLGNSWLEERIRPYLAQIIQQLAILKQMGIELKDQGAIIDPQKIFVDRNSQMLKLYDLSDFVVKDRKSSEIDQKEFLDIAKQTLARLINVDYKNNTEFSLIFKKIGYELETLKGVSQLNSATNLGEIEENYDQFILDKIVKVFSENPREDHKKGMMFLEDIRELYLHSAKTYQGKSDFEKRVKCHEKVLKVEENLKRTNSEKLEEAETKLSATVFGKLKAVLLDFSYFTFMEIMTYIGIAVLLLILGALYEQYSRESASKRDEKKKEDQKLSVFSSAWQKVKNLKRVVSNKSETSSV